MAKFDGGLPAILPESSAYIRIRNACIDICVGFLALRNQDAAERKSALSIL